MLLIAATQFSFLGSYPSSSSKEPSACFQIVHSCFIHHLPLYYRPAVHKIVIPFAKLIKMRLKLKPYSISIDISKVFDVPLLFFTVFFTPLYTIISNISMGVVLKVRAHSPLSLVVVYLLRCHSCLNHFCYFV